MIIDLARFYGIGIVPLQDILDSKLRLYVTNEIGGIGSV